MKDINLNYTIEQLQAMASALREIRLNFDPMEGICSNFKTLRRKDIINLRGSLFMCLLIQSCKTLNYYSGDDTYPIGYPDSKMDSKGYYRLNMFNLWDKLNPYCKRRIEVLDQMIIMVEELLNVKKLAK